MDRMRTLLKALIYCRDLKLGMGNDNNRLYISEQYAKNINEAENIYVKRAYSKELEDSIRKIFKANLMEVRKYDGMWENPSVQRFYLTKQGKDLIILIRAQLIKEETKNLLDQILQTNGGG